MIEIKISPEPGGAIFKDNWKKCVGTGRLGLALQKEYLDALELVQEHIGFSYIRGHGLFCDDVGIYREDNIKGDCKPFYNFTYIDRIIDSFLERGVRPFVELGFMPEKLASGSETLFYWRGNITPPEDYGKWAALVKAAIRHFISRYGMDEVRKWPFEVWNEPNLATFWKDADKEEYFKLYKVTAAAVKEVDGRLQVGGPAICGGADQWIADFLDFCRKEQAPVDFVSRHAYTSSQPVSVSPHLLYQEIWDSDYMINEFRSVREMIRKSPFPDLPFYITEYNTSWHPLNPIHDTVFNAAYLAGIISEGGDYADIFSYWTFSDVFEEQDIPRSQFHGGFGLVALNNIPKPAFHMFSFFARMGGEQLYRGRNILVTRRKDGSIAMVAWNPVGVKDPDSELEFEVSVPFDCEEIFMKRQVVNEKYANPLKTWMQMGRPRYPGKSMIETLRQAARPLLVTRKLDVSGGEIKMKIVVSRNEVTLIELFAVNDETESYIGLDDRYIGY
jgi:xylan 1,4-beta-xylosidase